MCEVGAFRRGRRRRVLRWIGEKRPHIERPLALLQHPQHTQALAAVGAGLLPGAYTVQKVLALGAQGFGRVQRDRLSFPLVRNRLLVLPLDGMRIQDQLVRLVQVVEHRHFAVTHDDQFLFLERVQPRNEHVGFHPAREGQQADGHVRDALMEIVAALSMHGVRHLLQQAQNHADVMRCEGPEDVLFATDFPEVQAVGVDILNPAQFPVVEERFQLQHCGMVPEEMPDHEDSAALLRQLHERLARFH